MCLQKLSKKCVQIFLTILDKARRRRKEASAINHCLKVKII